MTHEATEACINAMVAGGIRRIDAIAILAKYGASVRNATLDLAATKAEQVSSTGTTGEVAKACARRIRSLRTAELA